MPPRSRRSFLAAAGSAVLAGCSALDGEETPTVTPADIPSVSGKGTVDPCQEMCADPVYPLDGPEPLGYRAIPVDAGEPPEPTRARQYEFAGRSQVVGIRPRDEGLDVFINRLAESAFRTPVRLGIDADGAVTAREVLERLPSRYLRLVGDLAGQAVIGGLVYDDPRRTWLRGVGPAEGANFEYTTPTGVETTLAATTQFGSDLVAVGDSSLAMLTNRATVVRIGPGGSAKWRQTMEETRDDSRFLAVDSTTNRVVAGGTRLGDGLVVAFDPDGNERWQVAAPRGDRPYTVVDVAVGPTGTYALATAATESIDNDHLVLVALDADAGVVWQRVFDPGPGEDAATLYGVGVVDSDGPQIVGRKGSSGWLADLTPDGAVEAAGYFQYGGHPTRTQALAGVDGETVVAGTVDDDATSTPDIWLAWF